MRIVILLLLTSVLLTNQSSAQKTDPGKVPIPVQKFFMIRYPERNNEQFELIGDTMFEIKFDLNNNKCKTWFLKSGTWLGDETEMPVMQLKPFIIQLINKQYAGCTITNAYKLQDVNYATVFKVIIQTSKEEKELRFSENGEFIR